MPPIAKADELVGSLFHLISEENPNEEEQDKLWQEIVASQAEAPEGPTIRRGSGKGRGRTNSSTISKADKREPPATQLDQGEDDSSGGELVADLCRQPATPGTPPGSSDAIVLVPDEDLPRPLSAGSGALLCEAESPGAQGGAQALLCEAESNEVIMESSQDADLEEQERRRYLETLLGGYGLSEEQLAASPTAQDPDQMADKLHEAILKLHTSGGLESMQTIASTANGEDKFWEQMHKKKFRFQTRSSAGNPMGGRWNRRLGTDAKVKETYDQIVGREARAKFRADWAEGEYNIYREEKTYTESRRVERHQKKRMMPIERIAYYEGGGVKGMQRAVNWALECLKQTEAGWVEFHAWTKSTRFGYVFEEDDEFFRKEWASKRQWSTTPVTSTPIDDGPAASAREKPEGQESPEAPKGKGTPKGAIGKRGRGTADATDPRPPKTPKGSIPGTKGGQSAARRTKQVYEQEVQMADQLLRTIENDKTWAKYNNAHTLTDFSAAREALATLVAREPDLRMLLSMEIADAKRLMPKEKFDKILAGMPHTLDGLVATLNKERRRLVNSHAADMNTK